MTTVTCSATWRTPTTTLPPTQQAPTECVYGGVDTGNAGDGTKLVPCAKLIVTPTGCQRLTFFHKGAGVASAAFFLPIKPM